MQYLNGDLDIPIYQSNISQPVDTEIMVQQILLKQYSDLYIAKRNPTLCDQNAIFLVNLSNLGHWKDILTDGHCQWSHSKTKNFRYYVDKESVFKVSEDDIDIPTEDTIEVKRMIYRHKENLDFHKVVILIDKCSTACLQYYFEGQEHKVRPTLPHGNCKPRKNPKPFVRTKQSVLETIRNTPLPPKKMISHILQQRGGIENLNGPFDIPKNRQQVSNIKHHEKSTSDPIIEILDLAQMEKGTPAEFIRDVNLIPEVSVFVASKQQLRDIERFCTKVSCFCILGIDPTYNIGEFYVTVTTYRHLMFKTMEGVNPVLLGPCLIHSSKEFSSYYKLPESLIKANPNCKKILVFGTDSEKNVYQVFKDLIPNSYHLLCDIHGKKNISKKLSDLGVSKINKRKIMKDIFGSQLGDLPEKGLVDSDVLDDFERDSEKLMENWNKLGEAEKRFSQYFENNKLNDIRNCMSTELRAMAGLGFPPKPYTQNANECINSVIKRGQQTKSLSLKSVVQLLHSVVNDQENQVKLSLLGNGEWRLLPDYKEFQDKANRFYQMSKDQRQQFVEKFNTLPVIGATTVDTLSITPDACSLLYPPYSIIEEIFAKAAKILKSSGIMDAPGAPSGVYIVQNYESPSEPLTVTVLKNYKVSCQSKCKRHQAYQICEHILAVAEKENILKNFLDAYKKKNQSKYTKRKISDIADIRKSKNCGKKACKSTSKRYGKANTNRKSVLTESNVDIDVSRMPSAETPQEPASPRCTSQENNIFFENPVTSSITTETSTANANNAYVLKQSTLNIESNNNSYMSELILPIGVPLPPKPDMTEPQMSPYYLVKRFGKVAKCHGCGSAFDKSNHNLYVLKRNELDWWPKTDKANLTKQWCQSSRNHYYCVKLSCLQKRRPVLTIDHVSIYANENNVIVRNLVENFN